MRSHCEFDVLRQRVADGLASATLDIVGRVEKVLAAAHEVEVALPAAPPYAWSCMYSRRSSDIGLA